MAKRKKSIWENKVTFHSTIRQDINLCLVELAKEKDIPLRRVVELLIKESPTFKAKMLELKREGFFDY
jgi:hypothetical protein